MAIKLEKVVETFYQNLEEGKITGKKVPEVRRRGVPAGLCLQHLRLLGYGTGEISGKAKMHSIVMPAALSSKPEYKALGKFAYGEIELEEGSRFNGVVRGMTKKKRKQFLEEGKLPLPVKAAIYQRDGYKTVVFDLDEEE